MFKVKAENADIAGDDALPVEDSLGPGLGLQENGSWSVRFAATIFGECVEEFQRRCVEGANVILWHHSLGCFAVCEVCQELLIIRLNIGLTDGHELL